MDLKIAAIWLAGDVTLMTRHLSDFEGISGLPVANGMD
jgi:predicted nucleic acid-binding protein